MAVCDFNCFECTYSDCIYDSSCDKFGQYFDYCVSSEIDFILKDSYYQGYREEYNARRRKYYQDNKEKINARRRKYYQDNKDVLCVRQREYYRKCFGFGRTFRSSGKSF